MQRLDRNWSSLLQELRVTQTGVQLLTGFLLTLPFQARFTTLDDGLHDAYLATVVASLGATVLLGAALTGVAVVVFGTVLGTRSAVVAGAVTGAAMLAAWVGYPLAMRHRTPQ